jgi:hypothetical protein
MVLKHLLGTTAAVARKKGKIIQVMGRRRKRK